MHTSLLCAQISKEQFESNLISYIKTINKQCPIRTDEITTVQTVALVGTAITYKMVVPNNAIKNIDAQVFKNQMIDNFTNTLSQPGPFFEHLKQYGYYIRYLVYSNTGKAYYNITISADDILNKGRIQENMHNIDPHSVSSVFNFGTLFKLSIPNSLELKYADQLLNSSTNNETKINNLKYIEYPNGNYAFQPVGTNQYDLEARRKYARVLVAIESQNDFNQSQISQASPADINAIDKILMKDVVAIWGESEDFQWYKTTIKKVGNRFAIITKYQRPAALGGASPVYVEEYKFFLSSKLVTITCSYRVSEISYWKSDMEYLINSISFN